MHSKRQKESLTNAVKSSLPSLIQAYTIGLGTNSPLMRCRQWRIQWLDAS